MQERRKLEERPNGEPVEQKRIELRIKRLSRVCEEVKDKKIADLTRIPQ